MTKNKACIISLLLVVLVSCSNRNIEGNKSTKDTKSQRIDSVNRLKSSFLDSIIKYDNLNQALKVDEKSGYTFYMSDVRQPTASLLRLLK